jgi:group I intron endonuclease
MYTVYMHTTPSGKVYIGITKRKPERRWNNGNGYKQNKHFYSAIRKYHWENIKHEIVKNGLTKEQACAKEIELIAYYDSTNPDKGYNHGTGGECGALGAHHSQEARKRKSELMKEEYKTGKRVPAMKGKHLSEETRRKLREAEKGANNHNYGKHLSTEHKQRLSEALKGANSPNYGKHLSAETRNKLSEAHKGKKPSAECIRKSIEANKGKPAQNRKKVLCIETNKVYDSMEEASKKTKANRSKISDVCRGIRKTAGGYHWKYADMQKYMEESC